MQFKGKLPGSRWDKRKQKRQEWGRNKHMNNTSKSDLQNLTDLVITLEEKPVSVTKQLLLGKGQSSHECEIKYYYGHNEKGYIAKYKLMNLLEEEFQESLRYGDDQFIVFSDSGDLLVSVGIFEYATYLSVTITGVKQGVSDTIELINKTGRTKKQSLVSRIYKHSHGFDAIDLTLPKVSAPADIKAFYPFTDFTPKELWEQFVKSPSNVLLFIGAPGTGKTSYIRQMLEARGYENSVHLVDNEALLLDPDLMGYIQSESTINLLVTEDADRFVAKRENENAAMVGLLNASSGLAGGRIKFIISTNLPHLKSVDEALIRPGRCFKVIEFSKLSPEEANLARISAGLTEKEFLHSVTLAEALNDENKQAKLMQGIGFN